MQHVIGCDVHKRYSVFVAIDHRGRLSRPDRVEHERQTFRAYLQTLPAGSEIALEATGHWYWIVDEMEQAGHHPHLANPLEAKKRMGKPNKHDALDAGGLATRNYWNDYVFEAYVNHRPEVIFLAGLPDDPESRPHSQVSEAKGWKVPDIRTR